MTTKEMIEQGKTYLGIEFGSTRIKACLVDESLAPIAGGSHSWENRLDNGVWTYTRDDIITGLRHCYAELKKDVTDKFGVTLTTFGGMGISAMMHGYLAFDENDELLVPFRTWRNTMTGEAAAKLTELFGFNIPERWSIAHLYQAILSKESHVGSIAHLNTLAGFVHFLLTGERTLGVGDASGMFPIEGGDHYNTAMLEKFAALPETAVLSRSLSEILPAVAQAGDKCGTLTEAGAKLLDPAGDLKAGVIFAPPEGDAGTGMTATNAVRKGTGNVSAGTSIFSMIVLEKPMKGHYPQIDVVTTPDGADVAMVHCNNCCGELDKWVNMFIEFSKLAGSPVDVSDAYEILYKNALNGAPDCGGVVGYNTISGEPVVGLGAGRPAYYRQSDSAMPLADFFRAELYGAMAALKAGNDILFEKEAVQPKSITGHGGLFKVKGVAQQFLADALGSDVSVMSTAGEGGAWGMALLAAYTCEKQSETLADWLESRAFAGMEKSTVSADKAGSEGWKQYMKNYSAGIPAAKILGGI
ncbi:xylulokinase [uncultured Ruminococcus sp.]|uniref:xylulokinase n=1 Tax=uncultured Ruminococcus sp. TaxID=165186 RepID=UPI000ED8A422|nr:FGGY-family carbohydrate kinase [uncultured Ruminococcus sp.]HCJ41390.1 ATPase [Ruminococcus sp.]